MLHLKLSSESARGSMSTSASDSFSNRPESSFKLADVRAQSVAGDTKLIGKLVVIYGDKTRPHLDGLHGKAKHFDAEMKLYTVRLDKPLTLLDEHLQEVKAEVSRLLTPEEYQQLQKLEQESAELDEKRVTINKQNLDQWFAQFDGDASGALDRDELRALLTHLYPDMPPPSMAALDALMNISPSDLVSGRRLSLMASPTGRYGVAFEGEAKPPAEAVFSTRADIRKAVVRYGLYVNNCKWIDGIFNELDTDGSGFFEEAELRPLLKRFSPDGVVTETDLRYVWAKCDPDSDGKISREELSPLLAAWKEVAMQRTQQRMSEEDEKDEERAKQRQASPSKMCTIL